MAVVFIPTASVNAQPNLNPISYAFGLTQGTESNFNCFLSIENFKTCALNTISDVLASVFYLILSFLALILIIAGTLLDYTLEFTITNMRVNLDSLTGINIAWKVIKDLMNIAFIFLLVYEGIKLIIGASNREAVKKMMVGIVLAALLINFSLFFTKVLIDASNIITLGIYNTIINEDPLPVPIPGNPVELRGISIPFMAKIGLTSFWSNVSFDQMRLSTNGNANLIFMPILGIILFSVVSFVFFAIALMFLLRYLILIILLVLSPIAYMGMALPFMENYAKQWWQALSNQLLFAPIYMLMTWLVLILMDSPGFIVNGEWGSLLGTGGLAPAGGGVGTISLVFNFILIIGLVVASLVIAKSTSTKGSGYISSATDKFSVFAGGAVLGGTGWIGRKTIGAAGARAVDDADLQKRANEGRGLSGAWARASLYTARKAKDATFDARNATVPTNVIGDAIEGTVGRTTLGKKVGLNDVNIPSYALGATMAKEAGIGAGGTKGYADEKAESSKRIRDRESTNASELAMAQAKQDIITGSLSTANAAQIDKMEQALAKLSDKQTETLVSNNRELLNSLNFANAISVKQLEAINKNDQFSDSEKTNLKDNRFAKINTAMTTGTPASIASVRNDIRNLSDAEIEMLDTNYLGSEHFVSHLKPGQMESINKSSRFGTSQKTALRNSRRAPLGRALTAGDAALTAGNVAVFNTEVSNAKSVVRSLGHKEIAALDMATLTSPTMLKVYNPQILKRLAEEMNPQDIPILKDAILGTTTPGVSGDAATITWLGTPDGAKFS